MTGPTRRPALTLTPGRHPFEVGAFTAVAAVGAVSAIVPCARSRAIDTALSPTLVVVFYSVWCAWALIGLAGLALADQEHRLQVERAACYGVGYCALAYAVAAYAITGPSATTAALIVGVISPACAWRIRQHHRDLKALRAARADPQPADPPPLAHPDPTARGTGAE